MTTSQRQEVLRLRQSGSSIRSIAAEVFGDQRWRGRVERILARGPLVATGPEEAAGLDGLAPMEAIRVLFERRLAMLKASNRPPSMTELQKLIEVGRQLDGYAESERIKRAHELRRDVE